MGVLRVKEVPSPSLIFLRYPTAIACMSLSGPCSTCEARELLETMLAGSLIICDICPSWSAVRVLTGGRSSFKPCVTENGGPPGDWTFGTSSQSPGNHAGWNTNGMRTDHK